MFNAPNYAVTSTTALLCAISTDSVDDQVINVCYYHRRFGTPAHKCLPTFPKFPGFKKKKNQGNTSASKLQRPPLLARKIRNSSKPMVFPKDVSWSTPSAQVVVYLEDILMVNSTEKEQLADIQRICQRLEEFVLMVKLEKCGFV